MEMFLTGPLDGLECLGTQGSPQLLCSMTSGAQCLETIMLQGKTSLLAASGYKNLLVMCVIYSYNKSSLKTYCVAKHGAP